MKLVVGLGNPGRKYEGTRHNVGYAVVAELARRHGTSRPKLAFQGELVDANLVGVRALLLCPHTYMNRSGTSVGLAQGFYKIDDGDLLIVCDDFNLSLGKLRLRAKGSSGGQKGLEDIIRRLATEEFARLRIGIGNPPTGWEAHDWVLGRFTAAEQAEMEPAIEQAADAVVAWAREGTSSVMNRYNG